MTKICRIVHNKEKEKQRKDDFKEVKKKVDVINMQDIYFHSGFKNINSNKKLKKYDTVWITYNKETKERANGLFYFFSIEKTNILNFSGYKKVGKLIEAIFFNKYKIKHPKTISFFICEQNKDKYKTILEKNLSYPIVAKYPNSSKGKGVFLVKNPSACNTFLKEHINKVIIFQEYIENTGDYRTFVIQDKAPLTFKRFNNDDFRSNLYLGGNYEIITTTKKIKETCVKINKLFGCDFSGIDFFIKKNKEIIIIEINQMPGYKLRIKDEIGFNLLKEIFDNN